MNDALGYESSSGNVYADLGLPDADGMLRKAKLVAGIAAEIERRGWSQSQAAGVLGITQPKLSAILRGRFRGISEAKMMECLTRLGNDIQIVVTPRIDTGYTQGKIQVLFA